MSITIPSLLTAPLAADDSIFKPWYTPNEMLQMGIFGGVYFKDAVIRNSFPKDLFQGVTSNKYMSDDYINATNFFNVLAMPRNRGLNTVTPADKGKHPLGWFHWYCQYFYGFKIPLYISIFRIQQWKEELVTFSHYIEAGTYAPPNPNPNNYNKYTDPSYLPEWKQHMLHFSWDCSRRPIDYGIR